MEKWNMIKIGLILCGVLLLFFQNKLTDRDKKDRNKQEINVKIAILLLITYGVVNNFFIKSSEYQGEIDILGILWTNLKAIGVILVIYFIIKLIIKFLKKDGNISEFYKYDAEKKEYFLNPRFKIVGEIFGALRICFGIVSGLIILSILYLIIKTESYYMLDKVLIAIAGLPLVFLVLNEIHSFLDGNVKEKDTVRKKEEKVEEIKSEEEKTEYEDLYSEYKNIWGVNLLANSKIINPSTENIDL